MSQDLFKVISLKLSYKEMSPMSFMYRSMSFNGVSKNLIRTRCGI